jgi:hypothetical protein
MWISLCHVSMHSLHGRAPVNIIQGFGKPKDWCMNQQGNAVRQQEGPCPISACRCRNAAALPQYVKAFARKGQALQGLGRHREAAATFEAGLQVMS